MYYLQSRYYDATIGRFINLDEAIYATIPDCIINCNLATYCTNEPVFNFDYFGFFVIRRWMVSAIIDFILCLIPGIGGLFAPVKAVATTYGKTALKSKIAGPLGTFVKFLARNATKLINGLKKRIK